MANNLECKRCLYTADNVPNFILYHDGECNYCKQHDEWDKQYPTGVFGLAELRAIAEKIQRAGRNRKYNCIVGLSGGCDSSYTLHIVKDWLGLRPLAVNYDNGWDTKTARENIKRMCRSLKVDLKVYRPNPAEIIDIWRAFLEASVPDVEAPTDIALQTVLYHAAQSANVQYIFNGHSFRTEGWVPKGMSYMDGKYIQSVHAVHGTMPMKTFPNLTLSKFLWWTCVNRIKRIRPLYYVDYDKENVKSLLNKTYGWEWYGAHHAENKFTAWFGNYFRPAKCNFDPRLISTSALIRSKQLTRQEGERIVGSAFPFHKAYQGAVEQAMGWSHDYMREVINRPLVDAQTYPTYQQTFRRLKPLFWTLYRSNIIPKTFYEKYVK